MKSRGESAASDDSELEARLVELLTPQERQVLALVADGMSNAEIADRLGISSLLVKGHVATILRTLRAMEIDWRTVIRAVP